MRSKKMMRLMSLGVVLAMVLAACGSDDGDAGGDTGGGAGRDLTVIRFAFAPDPAWDYLADTGALDTWEEANGIVIDTSSTWDEFTFFAGGHGDIVSMGTQEIPVLEKETGLKTVTFGKYNYQRSPMMTRADTGYNELPDVPPGSNICVSSPVSNTQFWSVAMMELHGIDYRVGGGDYNLIVNDHFVNPQNLLNGDCEAAVIIPEAAAPYLRTGELVLMYDGEMPFQLYNRFSGFNDGNFHVMSNLFTATEDFFDNNPDEIKAFLALWQEGVDLWNANQEEIIRTYPQHFAVEAEEDVAWMVEFMNEPGNDWFVESVYLDEAWVEAERAIWNFMSNLNPENDNYLPPDFEQPRFEIVSP